MTDNEMLKYAIDNGMIDYDTIRKKVEMNERTKYLGMHPYEIFFSKDGLWHTYFPDEKKGRIPRKRKNKEDLINAIVEFWKEKDKSVIRDPINEKTTLQELFPIWLKFKSIHTTSTTAIKRIINDWNKYYTPETEFINEPIFIKTKTELETWAYEMINKHKMTKKQYYNMSLIIRQSLDYVADEDECWTFYQVNKFRKFKVDRRMFRPETRKCSEEEIYNYQETDKIKNVLESTNCSNNILDKAVYLWFYLGLRVAELAALKFEDFDFDRNIVHIHRQIVRDYLPDENNITLMKFNGFKVVEYTKGHDEREVIVVDSAKEIIEQVKMLNLLNGESNNGFVFSKNGNFILPQNFEDAIKRITRKAEVTYKSGHKIRKTYISMLIEAGINAKTVALMAGQHDIKTTFDSYTFNPNPRNEIKKAFEKALM